MPTSSLAGTVQDSKAQRQERLKSRFRDRGGIFVPSEENVLVDILLARGINGESPVKKRSSRKSAITPKPRPSASRSKTPRTGSQKRTARKSAREGDENYPRSVKKRRNTSKTSKLQASDKRTGMDTGTSAGLSRPQTTARRKSFADQLADAINNAQTSTVPDSCVPSVKAEHADPATLLGALPKKGKGERALGKSKAQPAGALLSRYSDELKPYDEGPVIKSPAIMVLERQQREKQDGHVNGARLEETIPPLLHDLSGSSSDSDIPLAKYAAANSKRARSSAGTRTKPKTGKKDASSLPTKKRGRPRVKAVPEPAEDSFDKATDITETVGTGLRRKRVLQEKTAPAKVPCKRKEHAKTSLDRDDNTNGDEHDRERRPPQKRRRADLTTSRGAKENKEMSRSAREAPTKVDMEKPLPSPVKKAARASPKLVSKAKTKAKPVKPPSRARTSARSGTRRRGLPLDVRRRIKVIAQNLPVTDVDDDDPINFLR